MRSGPINKIKKDTIQTKVSKARQANPIPLLPKLEAIFQEEVKERTNSLSLSDNDTVQAYNATQYDTSCTNFSPGPKKMPEAEIP